MMSAPTNVLNLVAYGAAGFLLAIGILIVSDADIEQKRTHTMIGCILTIILSAGVCVFLFCTFTVNWAVSGTIRRIASVCRMSSHGLLSLVYVVLTIGMLPGLLKLASYFSEWIVQLFFKTPVKTVLYTVSAIAAQIQLQYSCIPHFQQFANVDMLFFAVNTLAILLVVFLLQLLLKKELAMMIIAITSTLWSLINYFVTMFHGSPLFFSEFVNLFTAFDVVSGYHFGIDKNVAVLLVLSLVQFICAFLAWKIGKKNVQVKKKSGLLAVYLSMAASVVFVYTNTDLKPTSTMTGSWMYGVNDYGYICCLFEDVDRRINSITKPEGYTLELLMKEDIAVPESEESGFDPDIIIILNETFYDLRVYADIETDSDFLSDFYGIENVNYGYSIQPELCGGTNNTEFELLTSNSMMLLPITAPFTYLRFSSEKNSFADCLRARGYSTVAMHCGKKTNYARNRVYPMIGFDDCLLGNEQFTFKKYGNRPWLDSDNYSDLIDYYNKMGDAPRFIYMLTLQNHGGWDQNESENDIIHCITDLGENSELLNEYLSSLKKSGEAFEKLVSYYKTIDRPVLIFMTGDHAPSFLLDLPAKDSLSEQDIRLYSHMVPYAAWANFDYNWSEDDLYLTTTDIVPMIKKWIGIPLSAYDKALLEMHNVAPCRLVSGDYWTIDLQPGHYQPNKNDRVSSAIRKYLYMEYNLLKGGDSFRGDLFD